MIAIAIVHQYPLIVQSQIIGDSNVHNYYPSQISSYSLKSLVIAIYSEIQLQCWLLEL